MKKRDITIGATETKITRDYKEQLDTTNWITENKCINFWENKTYQN